jgi:hypothetical protein
MISIGCGPKYVKSCNLIDYVDPKWDYVPEYDLFDTEPFKDYAEDAAYILVKKNDVVLMLEEIARCDLARKSLLTLIKNSK